MNPIVKQMLEQGLSFYELCDGHKDNFREQIRDEHGLEYSEIDSLWEEYSKAVEERNLEIDKAIDVYELAAFRKRVWRQDFVDEMLKSDLCQDCMERGFVDLADKEQFREIAYDLTDLSLDEIEEALRDFERVINGLVAQKQKKQYILIDLECYTQQILPEHALETAIRDLKRLDGPMTCWVCEGYIVIEQNM